METIAGNKIIAEFDGWVFVPLAKNGFTPEHYERGHDWNYIDSFEYHRCWEDLMPVIEKIESLEFNVKIDSNYCVISKYNSVVTEFNKTNNKIEMVWRSVTMFIQWYNQNKTS
jgi:hypothetical protein